MTSKKPTATPKKRITLLLDADVIEWLKSKGENLSDLVNSILCREMNSHR